MVSALALAAFTPRRGNCIALANESNTDVAPPPDAAALAKENAELREQLATLKRPGALTPEQEKIVRQKVSVGLTREQAIGVLQAQQQWDEYLAKQEAEAKAKAATEAKAKAKIEADAKAAAERAAK